MKRKVYVIGAGFSAGLGFPLSSNLLENIWSEIPKEYIELIEKVIRFHNPSFNSKHPFTYPNIEELLTQLDTNDVLFFHTRQKEGGFKHKDLILAKNKLLSAMANKFHRIQKPIFLHDEKPSWLEKFETILETGDSTIISFNYDLVLEQLLFDDFSMPFDYGFDSKGRVHLDQNSVAILKPHGSLNWFVQNEEIGKLKSDRVSQLCDSDEVYLFNKFRQPFSKKGKHEYIPHIIPPTFLKIFEGQVYKSTFNSAVAALSSASEVFFLGYSLPSADFHSQFMIRCGLYNQIHGMPGKSKRSEPVGAAKITVVNPSEQASSNTSKLIQAEHSYVYHQCTVKEWVSKEIII